MINESGSSTEVRAGPVLGDQGRPPGPMMGVRVTPVSRSTQGAPEIDGYEYVRTIGRGGFSDVYLYTQLMPRREEIGRASCRETAGGQQVHGAGVIRDV